MFIKLKEHWPLVVIFVAPIVLIAFFFFRSSNYEKAVALAESGQYAEAFEIFDSLGDYKDSSKRAEVISVSHSKDLLKLISRGSIISFGTYEQDNNVSNGPENIEWLVLRREGNRILLISRYVLYCIKDVNKQYPWEVSDVRNWLNKIFLNEAFSASEQTIISTVKVTMEKNPEYDYNFNRTIYGLVDPEIGNDTYDKIFLLSISEIKQYFMLDPDLECKPTEYAKAMRCDENPDDKNCKWWLRTIAASHHKATIIEHNGSINYDGSNGFSGIGIRPAMWINLDMMDQKADTQGNNDSKGSLKSIQQGARLYDDINTEFNVSNGQLHISFLGAFRGGNPDGTRQFGTQPTTGVLFYFSVTARKSMELSIKQSKLVDRKGKTFDSRGWSSVIGNQITQKNKLSAKVPTLVGFGFHMPSSQSEELPTIARVRFQFNGMWLDFSNIKVYPWSKWEEIRDHINLSR